MHAHKCSEICEMSQIFKNLSQIDVALNCTYISNTSHTHYCSKTFSKHSYNCSNSVNSFLFDWLDWLTVFFLIWGEGDLP